MSYETDKINIVTVCDNMYATLLGALIKSIGLNHHHNKLIDFYIVSDKIKKGNKERIEDCAKTHQKIKLKWIPINTVFTENLKIPKDQSSFPANIYVRLMIPYFLPLSVEKALYLDVDMIAEEDIEKLWNTPLDDYPLAAVLDRCKVVSHLPWGIANYRELGLGKNTKYFNSGLLLLNLKEWRKKRHTEQILKCIRTNKKHVLFPDQYGLNVVFAEHWLELDPHWNTYVTENCENPFIIHFVGEKPIFANYYFSKKYRERFYHYLDKTPWKGFKVYNKYWWHLNKMRNRIKKMVGSAI